MLPISLCSIIKNGGKHIVFLSDISQSGKPNLTRFFCSWSGRKQALHYYSLDFIWTLHLFRFHCMIQPSNYNDVKPGSYAEWIPEPLIKKVVGTRGYTIGRDAIEILDFSEYSPSKIAPKFCHSDGSVLVSRSSRVPVKDHSAVHWRKCLAWNAGLVDPGPGPEGCGQWNCGKTDWEVNLGDMLCLCVSGVLPQQRRCRKSCQMGGGGRGEKRRRATTEGVQSSGVRQNSERLTFSIEPIFVYVASCFGRSVCSDQSSITWHLLRNRLTTMPYFIFCSLLMESRQCKWFCSSLDWTSLQCKQLL